METWEEWQMRYAKKEAARIVDNAIRKYNADRSCYFDLHYYLGLVNPARWSIELVALDAELAKVSNE
jgi:hypothetical protein